MKVVRTIDLFAGLGGIRLGFEQAAETLGHKSQCVFTSEIKSAALEALRSNFDASIVACDITATEPDAIPEFDYLLAGFPCQPFSYAGAGKGFADTRGTLFFDIERILETHSPRGFILENVEGLVKHDPILGARTGRTLNTIIQRLQSLGYHTSWKVLDASNFGVPQKRKRVYIVGDKYVQISLDNFEHKHAIPRDYLENGQEIESFGLAKKLLEVFEGKELRGKKIKDKRGGKDNIHSWEIGIKGEISKRKTRLMNLILTERRKKKWAEEWGIDWMDGMPLTTTQIEQFISYPELQKDLTELTSKGYLRFEHPKKLVREELETGVFTRREYDRSKPQGYNIVTGKLSFEINEVLDPELPIRTLVASDMSRIYHFDDISNGLRKLTRRESLRLSGYPEEYESNFDVTDKEFYDLIGNTVCVPVIREIAIRMLSS